MSENKSIHVRTIASVVDQALKGLLILSPLALWAFLTFPTVHENSVWALGYLFFLAFVYGLARVKRGYRLE